VTAVAGVEAWRRPAEVDALRNGSLAFLERDWDDDRALFSFSASYREGKLERDYTHPQTRRYTINSLLGLQAAGAVGVDRLVDRFLARHRETLRNPADVGLLTVLLSEGGRRPPLHALARAAERQHLDAQDLGWLLWGACAAGAEDVARSLFARLDEQYVNPRTLLPSHSLSRYRRRISSFGALVYFLRATYEYSQAFGDERAATLFRRGVDSALELQGPRGEWPWMIDVGTGRAFDLYPVFAVHQDSMAMLFLLPALAHGHPGVAEAIERSLAWTSGDNDLGIRMTSDLPCFLAYRSIERSESLPKLHRYARHLARRAATPAPPKRLRLNSECRSYHLGWILYAWSGER
jgi:hypothetical protein